ncbi:MAG: GNAT family N-acetyltransferase [Pirellulales bacterium]
MQVQRMTTFDELAPLADPWDDLSQGVLFRSWDWLAPWWKHYGATSDKSPAAELFVLAVFDESHALVGVAPWYLEHSRLHGRAIRFLGTGEVCSDHLSILCRPGMEDAVAEAIARWLAEEHRGDWDLLELEAVDSGDPAVSRLIEHLERRRCLVHRRPDDVCWRIELPATWEEYRTRLSKSNRGQIRQADRQAFETGRAVVHRVQRQEDLPRGIEILIDLHQRRRLGLGEPGCFASERFTAFHREAMARMLSAGRLRLSWLELDGRPVAVEYHLMHQGVWSVYQAGMEPEALHESPGRLALIVALRQAFAEGAHGFDFLRGDEPYKAHWRAEPKAMEKLRIVPRRTSARLRHELWASGYRAKQWIKRCLNLPGQNQLKSSKSRPCPSAKQLS